VRDLKPDALFVFVPSGAGAAVMKQFGERGMDKAGIKLIGTGDVTDDDQLNDMGDVALGVVTSHHYSAAHPSPANKKFVEAFQKANKGLRPNFMAVGGYDGMRVIYEALKKTGGKGGGDALLAGDEGPDLREPARPGVHRRADPRHRAEHLPAQGREEGRPAVERRVRRDQGREGSGQDEVRLTNAPARGRRLGVGARASESGC
jgi:hypothetical protein